jgi:hypothetical protein
VQTSCKSIALILLKVIQARNYLAAKIRAAVSVDYPDLEWGAPLTLRKREFKPTLWQMISNNDEC